MQWISTSVHSQTVYLLLVIFKVAVDHSIAKTYIHVHKVVSRTVYLYSYTHSQNDSGDLRGVAGGDGELGCLCGKAGTSHLCNGSAHSSG